MSAELQHKITTYKSTLERLRQQGTQDNVLPLILCLTRLTMLERAMFLCTGNSQHKHSFVNFTRQLHSVINMQRQTGDYGSFPIEKGESKAMPTSCVENRKDDNDFQDVTVVGMVKEKRTIMESFVQPFAAPFLYSGMSKGILMVGPPGTGKTQIIKWAVKNLVDQLGDQGGVFFYSVDGSTFKDKYVGGAEKRVRDFFRCMRGTLEAAQRENPTKTFFSILFIDEVDAIATDRSADPASANVVNELLSNIDNIKHTGANIAIIGNTNTYKNVDPAFLRRLQTTMWVGWPDETTVKQHLLQLVTEYSSCSSDVKDTINAINQYGSIKKLQENVDRVAKKLVEIKASGREVETHFSQMVASDVIRAIRDQFPDVTVITPDDVKSFEHTLGEWQLDETAKPSLTKEEMKMFDEMQATIEG